MQQDVVCAGDEEVVTLVPVAGGDSRAGRERHSHIGSMLCWSVEADDDSIATVGMICTKALVAGGEWTGGGSSGQMCVCGMSMGENVVCTQAAPHAHQSAPSVRTRQV